METNERINSENGSDNNQEVAATEITEHETETQNNDNGGNKPISKPNFSPEQQEWFNRVFIPNFRSGITKSNGNNALTPAEKQELERYREQFRQMEEQDLAQKGEFEELIARDLREVYDNPALLRRMEFCLSKKDKGGHRALLKTSRVRRTRQADGAVQSDLNVVDCEWWFELSTGKNVNPLNKLKQAEGDVIAVQSDRIPIVITREKGANSILATMRFNTLHRLISPNYYPILILSTIVVQIDYKDLLKQLNGTKDNDARK